MAAQDPSIDSVYSRNSTRIQMAVTPPDGPEIVVGRIQSMREDITNNVQVLDELGSAYAVELKKGITHFTFTVARFLTRQDAFEALKAGQVFAIRINDISGGPGDASIEYFNHCAITSLSYDYAVGQAVVGLNATIVTAGRGTGFPVGLQTALS
jgi:hypothetical protein